jgi:putative PIN family toxin of toxin-antitoxin system
VRVFFDTNVLASAFGTRGLCADVLGVVLSDHIFLTGECNLVELRRVLIAKFKVPNSTADDIDSFLRGYEIVPIPVVAPPASARDPDDDVVLASAIAGNADVLVTGDADLLELSGHFPFPILDPRGFWSMLRGKGAK